MQKCNYELLLYLIFRRSIEAIHGYEDKVRIVLNKADQVDHQELMRVYGALMWSIAKVSLTHCALCTGYYSYFQFPLEFHK